MDRTAVPARVGDDDAAVAAKGFALGTPHLERSEVVVQEQNGLSLSLLLVIEPDIVERSERHRLYILLTGPLFRFPLGVCRGNRSDSVESR
jgi:hypothetical protein